MKPILITDEGKNLIASAVSGSDTISFSRICTYDHGRKIVQSTPVSGIERRGNLCGVYGILDNTQVREGYYIEGLGLFAECSGGEILFGFCEENYDAFYMPAGNEKSRTEVTLRIELSADCPDNLINNLILRPNSDAYASAVHLQAEISRLDDRINSLNFDIAITEKINEHNLDPDAHSAFLAQNNVTNAKFSALISRLDAVETVLQSDITANSAVISFADLNGAVFNGIWNNSQSRIEF